MYDENGFELSENDEDGREKGVPFLVQTTLPIYVPWEDAFAYITHKATRHIFGREIVPFMLETNDYGYAFVVIVTQEEADRVKADRGMIIIQSDEVTELIERSKQKNPCFYLEAEVVTLYDKGELTPQRLDAFMKSFEGNKRIYDRKSQLRARDGLDYKQIVCKVMKPKEYEDAVANPFFIHSKPDELDGKTDCELWYYNTRATELFRNIWCGIWRLKSVKF